MKIRINQLKIKEWLTSDPLATWYYYDIKPFKGNLIAQILSAINNWGINIRFNTTDIINFEGKISIQSILREYYRKYKDVLRAKNLLFLDQLRDEDYLFTWKQLHINSRFSQQGKIPKWWNIIEERVLKDNSRIIKDEYNSSNDVNSNQMFNEQLLMPTKIDGRKNT